MKLQVTQENLSRALSSVSRVASSRNALPILSNVLLKTVDSRLSVSATNLDIAITQYAGAKISDEGSITVPARLMHDFVASLPQGVITIELEDQKVHITTDQYTSTINGVSAEDFPVMPAIADAKEWSCSSKELKKALSQVLIAASGDDTRPILTGVYFYSHDGELYLAATDSYRLAEKRFAKTKEEIRLLVPASALNDLLRVLGDGEEQVTIFYDDQQIRFSLNDTELVSRQIDGTYPDYRKLIPADFKTVATLTKEDFVNITRVSSLFARESAGSVTLQVDDTKQKISITSIASQLGDNTAEAEAVVTGEGGKVTLNSRYILDALAVFQAKEITFSFNDKLGACVLTSEQEPDYKHIIMPLRS